MKQSSRRAARTVNDRGCEWRAGHERFWHSEQMRESLGDPHFRVDDDTPVVAQAFRLVEN
jgi:hypothetical protein